MRGTRFLFTGFVPNRSNKSAAPNRFGSNCSVMVWRVDGGRTVETVVRDGLFRVQQPSGWKLDTQRVGNGSPSLDSQTHTSRSSCCVHMGSTASYKYHRCEYTRVVDDLNVYSTRVKFLHNNAIRNPYVLAQGFQVLYARLLLPLSGPMMHQSCRVAMYCIHPRCETAARWKEWKV